MINNAFIWETAGKSSLIKKTLVKMLRNQRNRVSWAVFSNYLHHGRHIRAHTIALLCYICGRKSNADKIEEKLKGSSLIFSVFDDALKPSGRGNIAKLWQKKTNYDVPKTLRRFQSTSKIVLRVLKHPLLQCVDRCEMWLCHCLH